MAGDTLFVGSCGRTDLPECPEAAGGSSAMWPVEMQKEEITIAVKLGRGDAKAVIWTTDFSYDYVKINADYRS